MKFTKTLALLFPAVCLFTMIATAQTASGKLLLAKGQKLQIDNSSKMESHQEMMGQAMEITSDANMIYRLEVKDKKNDSYLLSSTLTKLTTNGSAMGQEMKFDSDKKEDLETEMGKFLKNQLNVSMDLEMNESAKVTKGVKKDTAAAGSGQLMDMMKSFSQSNVDESNGANAAFEVMPAGKKLGDSWSDSSITEEIKTYRNYTIKAVNGNNATVLIDGRQVTKKKMEQQGMEINVSMEGKLTGEGIVDMATGIIKQRITVLDGTSSTEVMGQSIPGTIKVTTITTVKTI